MHRLFFANTGIKTVLVQLKKITVIKEGNFAGLKHCNALFDKYENYENALQIIHMKLFFEIENQNAKLEKCKNK